GWFNRALRGRGGCVVLHVRRLRHTCASRYLERGGQLAALKEILKHASIRTTQRYAKLLLAHVQKDAARVQERAENGLRFCDSVPFLSLCARCLHSVAGVSVMQ